MRAVAKERGTASVELAVVTPALIALVVGILQFGLWYHAEVVTRAAAMEAARIMASEDGTSPQARARAAEMMRSSLDGLTTTPVVSISLGAETARARVQARMRPIIPLPGLRTLSLDATAIAWRERFRAAD